jgi:hypothetical protein
MHNALMRRGLSTSCAALACLGLLAVPAAARTPRLRVTGRYTGDFALTVHATAGIETQSDGSDPDAHGSAQTDLSIHWSAPVIVRHGRPDITHPLLQVGRSYRTHSNERVWYVGVPIGSGGTVHGTAHWSGTVANGSDENGNPLGQPYSCAYDVGGAGFAALVQVNFGSSGMKGNSTEGYSPTGLAENFVLVDRVAQTSFPERFGATCTPADVAPKARTLAKPEGLLPLGLDQNRAVFSLPKLIASAKTRANPGVKFHRSLPFDCCWAIPSVNGPQITIDATAKLRR